MQNTPITLSDIALFATIASAVFAIMTTGLKLLVGYLTARFGSTITPAQQSEQCRFNHAELNGVLLQQNANIATMLKQNGEQIKALSDGNHAAELRHQITMAKLDRIDDHLRTNGG